MEGRVIGTFGYLVLGIGFWAVGFALMFADGDAYMGASGWFTLGADNSPATGDAYEGIFSKKSGMVFIRVS